MGIVAKSGNSDDQEKELLPAGSHVAVCYGMIDLGTQKITFKGVEKSRRQVRIAWELSEHLRTFKEENGAEPVTAGKTFSLSMYEKAGLRTFMEGWRGKKYTKEEAEAVDITKMLGVACMLNIAHGANDNGEQYASVTGATLMHPSIPKPVQHNPSYFFSLDEYNEEQYLHLPKWMQEKIAESPEYKAIKNPVVIETKTEAPAEKKEPTELTQGTPLFDKVVKYLKDNNKTQDEWESTIHKNYKFTVVDENALYHQLNWSSLPF